MNSRFLKYQREWLSDKTPLKVWEKSRRIGASWCEAAFAVTHAALGGGNVYYLSYDKDMTRQFIEDARGFAKEFQNKVQPATVQDDPDKDNLVFEIKTASGKVIRSLTSEPRNFRSKGAPGDLFIIDEAAFVNDLNALLKAAAAVRMWGGHLHILSTHNGEDNAFNTLVQDIRKGSLPSASLHRTDLDAALADGLYRKICEVNGNDWTAEAEHAWRDGIIKDHADNAAEELFVVPARGGGAWLSGALIEARQSDDLPAIEWRAPAADFSVWSDAARTREFESFWRERGVLAVSAHQGAAAVGVDFARSADLSVFAVMHMDNNMHRRCWLIELRDIPFQQQEQLYERLTETLSARRGLLGSKLDARGNGQYLAERAVQRWGQSAVEAVMLTEEWYRNNMPPLKAAFEDGMIRIPRATGVYDDLRSVKLVRGVPRVPDKRTADVGADKQAGAKRHGDAAIAIALAFAVTRAPSGALTHQAITERGNDNYLDQLKEYSDV